MLETELKELALKEGAIRAGIARKEAFSEAPPSADMQYLKPWANAAATRNLTFGKRGVLDRPRENIKTTCNHCITVCSGPLETRKKWMNLLFDSGVVELDEEGNEMVVKTDEQGNRTVRKAVTEVN